MHVMKRAARLFVAGVGVVLLGCAEGYGDLYREDSVTTPPLDNGVTDYYGLGGVKVAPAPALRPPQRVQTINVPEPSEEEPRSAPKPGFYSGRLARLFERCATSEAPQFVLARVVKKHAESSRYWKGSISYESSTLWAEMELIENLGVQRELQDNFALHYTEDAHGIFLEEGSCYLLFLQPKEEEQGSAAGYPALKVIDGEVPWLKLSLNDAITMLQIGCGGEQ